MTGGYVEKSFAPAPADLEAIGAFTRRAFAPEELYVFSVVLCNNDVDRDHEKFTRQALEKLGALFVGKTGIFDHSMKSGDQAARIYATAVVPVPGRKTADGEDLVTLQAKAYMVRTPGNAELITQIDGGIKKEVSVSCAMGSAVCSLCGADRRSETVILQFLRKGMNPVVGTRLITAARPGIESDQIELGVDFVFLHQSRQFVGMCRRIVKIF